MGTLTTNMHIEVLLYGFSYRLISQCMHKYIRIGKRLHLEKDKFRVDVTSRSNVSKE